MESVASPITVVIADDHDVTRIGLRTLLQAAPGIELVGEAADGCEAQQLVTRLKPRVLLLDLIMPGPKPADIVLWAVQHHPETTVLILTAHDRDYYLAQMLHAGAAGYLDKNERAEELVDAIRRAAQGQTLFTQYRITRYDAGQAGGFYCDRGPNRRQNAGFDKLNRSSAITDSNLCGIAFLHKDSDDARKSGVQSWMRVRTRGENYPYGREGIPPRKRVILGWTRLWRSGRMSLVSIKLIQFRKEMEMEKRIWKIVWLLGGIVLTLSLALATGILTLPPDSSGASEIGIVELASTGTPQPSEEITNPVIQYPTIPSAAIAIATQDWLVYVNETYGFQIRYPAHFYTTTWEVVSPREMSISFIDRKWEDYKGGTPSIGIVIYSNPQKLPLRAWVQAHTGDPADPKTAGNVLFVDPDKIEAVETANMAALKFVDGGFAPVPSVLIDRGKYILRIGYPAIGPDNLEPVYELMLATLEFEPLSRQEQE